MSRSQKKICSRNITIMWNLFYSLEYFLQNCLLYFFVSKKRTHTLTHTHFVNWQAPILVTDFILSTNRFEQSYIRMCIHIVSLNPRIQGESVCVCVSDINIYAFSLQNCLLYFSVSKKRTHTHVYVSWLWFIRDIATFYIYKIPFAVFPISLTD